MAFGSPRRYGTATGLKMPVMYRSAFKLPLIQTRVVRVVYLMSVQAIALSLGTLCRYRMQAGEERSLQTRIRHSDLGLVSKEDIVPLPYPTLSFCATESPIALYSALSMETEVIVALMTVKAAENVVSSYKHILSVLQTLPFPD
ncbi:hypothetical protein TNCV_504871 [Trichonephila clavipes]|nr:hypothetical protein TNCV_504871 [Trichonephila clavipes]